MSKSRRELSIPRLVVQIGLSRRDPLSAAGIVIRDKRIRSRPGAVVLERCITWSGIGNDELFERAVLGALDIAAEQGSDTIEVVCSSSEIRQLADGSGPARAIETILESTRRFERVRFTRRPRKKLQRARQLARLATKEESTKEEDGSSVTGPTVDLFPASERSSSGRKHGRRKKGKIPGRWCWSCQRRRPNERFSDRKRARGACRECRKLGKEELDYRQAVRDMERVVSRSFPFIPRKQRKQIERFLSAPQPRVRDHAKWLIEQDARERTAYREAREAEEALFENLEIPEEPPEQLELNFMANEEIPF